MADKKISELTELTTPDGTEELVVNDSGVSKKVQIDNLIADNGLSGDKIDGGTISNFTSTGIDDNATSTKMTLNDTSAIITGGGGLLSVQRDVDAANQIEIFSAGVRRGYIGANSTAIFSAATAAGTERMRITSAGDVLVGKTTTAFGTAGSRFISNGQIQATASGNEPYFANRLSSDGVLFDFRKDGTTVGSIGSYAGAHLRVGSGETNILFASASGMLPSTSSGTASDGLIDIGGYDRRFKDLYLSGGVRLGGTAAANALDDYEEGTWTPQYAGGTVVTHSYSWGRYTKVGNIVHISFFIRSDSAASSADSITITGLPFTHPTQTPQGASVPVLIETNNFNNRPQAASINPNSTSIELYETPNAGNSRVDPLIETDLHVSNGYNLIYGTVSFRTNN